MSLWALPGWSHTQDSNQTMLPAGAPTCQRPLPVTWNLRILERPSPWGPWSHPVALSPLLFYPLPPPSTFFLNTQATSVQKCLPGRPAPHVDLFDESYHPCLITTDSPTSDPKLLKAGTTYHLFRVLSTFSNIFVDCCMLPPKKNKNSGKQERKTWNILELNFHYINWKDPDNAKQLVSSNSFKHDLRE